MANIREFANPINDLQPTEVSARLTAQLANDQAQTGRQIGSAVGGGVQAVGDVGVKYATYKDTTALAGRSATLLASKMLEWQQLAKTSDPNDPTVAQNFLENNLKPSLDALRESAWTEGGQSYAGNQADSIFAHLTTMTAATTSAQAGEQTASTVAQVFNALSGAAAADPASVDMLLKHLDDAVNKIVASNPALTADQVAHLKSTLTQAGKQEIAKSAVQAAIQGNPDAGLALAARPSLAPYINGAEVKQFEAYARAQKIGADSAARQAANDKRLQEDRLSANTVGAYEAQFYNDKGEYAPPPGIVLKIMNDKNISDKDRGPFMGMANRLITGQNKDDSPGLVSHLLIQAAAGEIDASDIYKYVGVGNPDPQHLSNEGYSQVMAVIKSNPEVKQGAAMLVGRINEATAKVVPPPAIGGALMSQGDLERKTALNAEARLLYFEGIKEGKKPSELLTPGKPDYIFTDDFVKQYAKPTGPSTGALLIRGVTPAPATSSGKAGGRVDETAPPAKALPPVSVPAIPGTLDKPAPAAATAPAALAPNADGTIAAPQQKGSAAVRNSRAVPAARPSLNDLLQKHLGE